MADFGGALAVLRQSVGPFSLVLPTLPHIEREVRALAADWPEPPTIVLGEDARDTPRFAPPGQASPPPAP